VAGDAESRAVFVLWWIAIRCHSAVTQLGPPQIIAEGVPRFAAEKWATRMRTLLGAHAGDTIRNSGEGFIDFLGGLTR
jgi:hypothetical protein